MMITTIILLLLIGYLFGSIPTAYILGKLVKNIDIREHGSGNVGATNVLRVLGKKWGGIALFIDLFKGALAVILAQIILPSDLSNLSWILLGVGLMAFLGHLFPVWLKFKGGKGVAVAAGVFIVLKPIELGIILLVFILIVYLTKYVSLGSIVSAILLSILVFINLSDQSWDRLYPFLVVTPVITILVVLLHRKNIVRLINGNENKIFSSTQ